MLLFVLKIVPNSNTSVTAEMDIVNHRYFQI